MQPSGTSDRKRLAAILAADAAGYTRAMAADEAATIASLDAARAVFRRLIESHEGRVVDMAGDSVLSIFDLASSAVAAALAIQRDLAVAAKGDRAGLRFRIGVHLGEVVEKADGTIYGDGVNIAARLEGLADPGGVAVSDSVRNAVKGKVAAGFEDLGEQAVKNVDELLRAYRVGTASAKATPAEQAVAHVDLSLPDRPSIAILPFTNMTGEPRDELFADGVAEDIITELSRFRSLFVIARNSSFSYKGRSPDVRQVGSELGVRYVLEGSLRKTGKRVRVSAQLIDSLTGGHIWAEKYDRVLEDLFELQDEITRSIVSSIAPQIEMLEWRRSARPGNLNAYELGLLAFAAASRGYHEGDRSAREEAVRLANQALALDPRCGGALRTLAFAHWQHIHFGTAAEDARTRAAGLDAAARAIAVDSGDPGAHLFDGLLRFQAGDQEAGLAAMRRALELNPGDTQILLTLGFFEAASGNPQRGIEHAVNALRFSPRDPRRYNILNTLAWSYFIARDYIRAVEAARSALAEAPKLPNSLLCLTVSYVGAGHVSRAKSELEGLRQVAPEMVESRLSGKWLFTHPKIVERTTTFLRVAAGTADPSAAEALR